MAMNRSAFCPHVVIVSLFTDAPGSDVNVFRSICNMVAG